MEIKTFVPRAKRVQAVRLSAENSIDVARWCNARVREPKNARSSGGEHRAGERGLSYLGRLDRKNGEEGLGDVSHSYRL